MPRLKLKTAAIAVVSATAAAAIGLSVNVGPAAAGEISTATQSSLAYTSSAHPGKSYTNPPDTVDLPVGTSGKDTSRIYATYDLTPYAGKHIVSATIFAEQAAGNDCSGTATDTVEIWTTKTPTGKISWKKAPAEVADVGSLSFRIGCPNWNSQAVITDAVGAAVESGATSISLELRVPVANEANPLYGTTLDGERGVLLSIQYNSTPITPTNLSQDEFMCATAQPYPFIDDSTPTMRANTSDPDSDDVQDTSTFQVWPVGHPDQATTFTGTVFTVAGTVSAHVPTATPLADNTTYAWKVRTTDGVDTSAWSSTCYFTEDMTPPANAPIVTSSNFPAGQTATPGAPGTFTFSPNGADDIIGYAYNWGFPGGVVGVYYINDQNQPVFNPFAGPDVVRANSTGSTTVNLSPPTSGPESLYVESIDKAYNVSAEAVYQFFLPDNSPTIGLDVVRPTLGEPFALELSPNPNAGHVDSYQIQIDGGTATTVPANADGTATTSVTLDQFDSDVQIEVRSHSLSGLVSAPADLYEFMDGEPIVASTTYPENVDGGGVGVTGTFTFTPTVDNVISYTYSFDYGPSTTIPANGAGDASVTWAPDAAGFHDLNVYATTADGTVYDAYDYGISVIGS